MPRKPARRLTCRVKLKCEELEARLCLSTVSFVKHTIEADRAGVPVYGADLDGDSDLDLLTIHTNTLPAHKLVQDFGWYENTDGSGGFGQHRSIVSGVEERIQTVRAGDLDSDGDADIIVRSISRSRGLVWYENIDGEGSFREAQAWSSSYSGPRQPIDVADLDSDGDLDIMQDCSWFENTDGAGAFRPDRIWISRFATSKCHAADIDGDADLDIVETATSYINLADVLIEGHIRWYENADSRGTFVEMPVFDGPGSYGDYFGTVADIDNDGDIDILAHDGTSLGWYENTDGAGTFGDLRSIASTRAIVSGVYAIDMDGDDDVDVLGSATTGRLIWHDNPDGDGTRLSEIGLGFSSTIILDIDGDGDMDFLDLSGPGLVWYEQVRLSAGDANRDLQFNQLDIVQVLSSAKYLTGESATWSEGDWNGDGVFDQKDIVAALATGNYLRGQYVETAITNQGN